VQTFTKLKDNRVKLVLCGDGDAMNPISAIAEYDKRIIVKGKIPHSEVMQYLHSASILINPRKPEGEYTKYSFPSKTMELLASGVPTIMYKLPAIPEEYFNYSIALNDTSDTTLLNAIENLLSMPLEDRVSMGNKARQFIINNKNPKIQVNKILKLLKNNVSI
jgi:glycosyltransferase involved in cell wall biosynthesis